MERATDWNKITAIGTLGCFLMATLAWIVAATKYDVRPWVVPSILVILALGLAGFFCIRAWKEFRALRRLPLSLVLADCRVLLSEYQRPAFDFPVDARLPLNHASLPNYGEVWQYQHVVMHGLKTEFWTIISRIHAINKARSTYRLWNLDIKDGLQNMVIVEVISTLEKLEKSLEAASKE